MNPRSRTKFDFTVVIVDVRSEKLTHYCSTYASIALRKFFNCPKDLTRLILLNSSETVNDLSDDSNYRHISVVTDLKNFDVADAKHLLAQQSGQADWLDCLIVALHYMKQDSDLLTNCLNKQIVLFSDLAATPGDPDMLQYVVNGVERLQVQLFILGPRAVRKRLSSCDDVQMWMAGLELHVGDSPTERQNANTLKCLAEKTGCVVCEVDIGHSLIWFYKEPKPGLPWKASFTLAPGVSLPVSAHKMIFNLDPVKYKSCDFEGRIFIKDKPFWFEDDEEAKQVSAEDKVPVYVYHGVSIPMPAAGARRRADTTRGLKLIGFTPKRSVPESYYKQSVTYALFPDPKSASGQAFFDELCNTMLEMDVVAVVEKVYNAGLYPVPVVLIPTKRNDLTYMTMAQLPFKNEIRIKHISKCSKRTESRASPEVKEALGEFLSALKIDDENADLLSDARNCLAPQLRLDQNQEKEYAEIWRKYCQQILKLEPGNSSAEERTRLAPDDFLVSRSKSAHDKLLQVISERAKVKQERV